MGKWLLFGTLTVLTGIVAVGQAQAGHVSCGDTLTTNTTLDENLNCAAAPGLVIGANNITLDCAEFKIEGPGTDPVCCPTVNSGIELSGRTGVTVKNCRVENFSAGFQIGGSSFNTFTDNRASNNGGVAGTGFFVFGGSNNNTLTDNRANENVFGIILSAVFGGTSNNTLTYNRANENTGVGFVVENSPNNTLTGNRANENSIGFQVYLAGSVNNSLTGNRADDNGAGFFMFQFASGNTLTENRACGNGTFDAGQVNTSGNTFVDNEFCTTSGI